MFLNIFLFDMYAMGSIYYYYYFILCPFLEKQLMPGQEQEKY